MQQSTLSARTGFEFVLAGVVDSRRSLLSYDGLDASRALAFFNDEAVEQDEESLFLWMRAHPYDDLVVLDVTASQQLADQYLDFASHGFHVISANKLAGASDSNKYRQIHDAFEKTGRHWLYNATVGAGLPINHTVRDLIDSGDTILSISGIFSGIHAPPPRPHALCRWHRNAPRSAAPAPFRGPLPAVAPSAR